MNERGTITRRSILKMYGPSAGFTEDVGKRCFGGAAFIQALGERGALFVGESV